MNLIVDIGNTLVKCAVFQQYTLLSRKTHSKEEFLKEFQNIFEIYPNIEKVMLSSVGNLSDSELKALHSVCPVLVLTSDTKVPFKNLYSTPKSLGMDRVALISAAIHQFPNSNVLVIDAGTCITYDMLTADGEYLGGAISPGIRLRYITLNTLTAKLPLLETEVPKHRIGTSTAESIHSGVINGVLKEIDGNIDEYKEQFLDLTVILTGGDAKFLSKQLKNSIFANSNFLLEGLNFILEYNSN